MNDEGWKQTWDVFEAAAELPQGDQAAFVHVRLPDPVMSARVFEMLERLEDRGPDNPARATEPEWTRLGQTIGRFRIVAPLGRGGIGEVYQAIDTELDRSVAIKFLASKSLGSTGGVERLQREALAASALNHPNLVTVHEILRTGPETAIVMERVEGQPLRAFCGRPNRFSDAAHWGVQIARALSAAHAHHIIHRDIKPENVMLRPDGYVKILDFGLARQLGKDSADSTSGVPIGTIRYMSPEQTRADPLTPATDIFSLGLVLYELATGRHPFDADSALSTSHRIASEAAERPSISSSSLPRGFDDLLLAMLAKDPRQRPSAPEVASRLEELLAPRLQAPASRYRWIWAAVGIAALLPAVLVWRSRAPKPGPAPRTPVVAKLASFTSLPGDEMDPCFSPDGKHVIYAWNGGSDSESHDIYYRALGVSDPVRLTSDPADEFSPVWSPDGRAIAFLRSIGSGIQVVVMSARGTNPRIVAAGAAQSARKRRLAWAPDGKAVIFGDDAPGSGDALGLYRVSIGTGERGLLFPEREGHEDLSPTLSPDRRQVAFVRVIEDRHDLWVARSEGSQARRLIRSTLHLHSVAWNSASDGLYYVQANTPSVIRFVSLDGVEGPSLQVEGSIHHLTASPAGGAICYLRRLSDGNIWRYSPSTRSFEQLVNSTAPDEDPRYSPSGRAIAFYSARAGLNSIWVMDSNGGAQRPVVRLNGHPGSPSWSPREDWVAFDNSAGGETQILAVRLSDGALRTLAFGYMPIFSATTEAVYFTSKRSGRNEIWQAPLEGGPARQITDQRGLEARESPDGKWLYYSKPAETALYRRPLGGGPEEQLTGVEPFNRYWDVAAAGVYYVSGVVLRLYDPNSRQSREIARLPKAPIAGPRGLSAAPDGSVIMNQYDTYRREIVVASQP